MTRLVVTSNAEDDLNKILDYLKGKAGALVAEEYGLKFLTSIERLANFPGVGSRREAFGPNARVVVVPPYVLIYDYASAEDTVTLLRILHGKRNITRRLVRSDD